MTRKRFPLAVAAALILPLIAVVAGPTLAFTDGHGTLATENDSYEREHPKYVVPGATFNVKVVAQNVTAIADNHPPEWTSQYDAAVPEENATVQNSSGRIGASWEEDGDPVRVDAALSYALSVPEDAEPGQYAIESEYRQRNTTVIVLDVNGSHERRHPDRVTQGETFEVMLVSVSTGSLVDDYPANWTAEFVEIKPDGGAWPVHHGDEGVIGSWWDVETHGAAGVVRYNLTVPGDTPAGEYAIQSSSPPGNTTIVVDGKFESYTNAAGDVTDIGLNEAVSDYLQERITPRLLNQVIQAYLG